MTRLAVLVSLVFVAHGAAQQPTPGAVTEAQRQRAMRTYLPSEAHDQLKRLVGKWEQTTEYAAGEGKTTVTRGTVVNRATLGDRFVVSEGTARDATGTFETGAMLIFGFDGRADQHTVIVLDTFGTYYVTAAGSGDASRVVMRGETPERGGTKRFDVTLEWLDNDTYVTRIVFHLPGQPPVPAVVSTHRRVRP